VIFVVVKGGHARLNKIPCSTKILSFFVKAYITAEYPNVFNHPTYRHLTLEIDVCKVKPFGKLNRGQT
jgi:hypothetical protein